MAPALLVAQHQTRHRVSDASDQRRSVPVIPTGTARPSRRPGHPRRDRRPRPGQHRETAVRRVDQLLGRSHRQALQRAEARQQGPRSRISASSGSRRSTTGCGPTGTRGRRPPGRCLAAAAAVAVAAAAVVVAAARAHPIIVGGLGNGDANNCGPGARRRRHPVHRRDASTRRHRTTSSPSMRATARCSGTTTGRPAAARRTGTRGPGMLAQHDLLHGARRLGHRAGRGRPARKSGGTRSRRSTSSTSRRMRRWRSATTCSSAPATTSTRRRS